LFCREFIGMGKGLNTLFGDLEPGDFSLGDLSVDILGLVGVHNDAPSSKLRLRFSLDSPS
jgi:hypothetical protein